MLVSDGRGTLGRGREGLYLTFPRILAFDPLAGICLSDRHFLFLKVCVCVFGICPSTCKHADTCISIFGLAPCTQQQHVICAYRDTCMCTCLRVYMCTLYCVQCVCVWLVSACGGWEQAVGDPKLLSRTHPLGSVSFIFQMLKIRIPKPLDGLWCPYSFSWRTETDFVTFEDNTLIPISREQALGWAQTKDLRPALQ